MKKTLGITIVEVVVVCAIALSVFAVIWFALGPSSKRKAYEAGVRSDLHQLHLAMRLYMEDYDGILPLSLGALKKQFPDAPTRPSQMKNRLPECASASLLYIFTRSHTVLRGEGRYQAKYPFDPAVHPVVKAPFFCRRPGTTRVMTFLDGGGKPTLRNREAIDVLGVRLDGHVGWFNEWDTWEEEYANKAHRR